MIVETVRVSPTPASVMAKGVRGRVDSRAGTQRAKSGR